MTDERTGDESRDEHAADGRTDDGRTNDDRAGDDQADDVSTDADRTEDGGTDGANRSDDATSGDPGPATDVFALVGQETRAAILTALADHARAEPDEPGLPFSVLRRRVGHDDPGNFNYHLDRLVGGPVERTDAGYRLSGVGQRLVGAALSGRFDPAASTRVDRETDCPVCGGRATVRYADGGLRIDCEGHGAALDVGPEVVERLGVDAARRVGFRRGTFDLQTARLGVCPFCEGPTDGRLVATPDEDPVAHYEATCRRCGGRVSHTAGGCVLDHPAVVSHCWDHGIDVRDAGWRVLTEHVDSAVVADDPFRVAVTVSVGDDAVRLTLDADCEVVRVE